MKDNLNKAFNEVIAWSAIYYENEPQKPFIGIMNLENYPHKFELAVRLHLHNLIHFKTYHIKITISDQTSNDLTYEGSSEKEFNKEELLRLNADFNITSIELPINPLIPRPGHYKLTIKLLDNDKLLSESFLYFYFNHMEEYF